MSGFSEVERDEIAVQFIRVPDGLDEIGRAWNELEAVVALRGRHFYGAYDPIADDYRACVEVREGDELAPGLAEALGDNAAGHLVAPAGDWAGSSDDRLRKALGYGHTASGADPSG